VTPLGHGDRRRALAQRVEDEGLDAFLVVNAESSDRANLFYLTGFSGSFGLLWVGKEAWLATDSRYTEQASAQAAPLPIEELNGRWLTWLGERLADTSARRVGVSAASLTVKILNDLRAHAKNIEFVPTGSWVEELRQTKDGSEVEQIAAAAELTDAGLRWILGRIRPGMTEQEIALELEFWCRKNGAQDMAFEPIVASGPHSSRPHHRPGSREVREGEVILFDIGVRRDAYCADLTRVVSLGRPEPRVQEIYEFVLKANQAGIEAVHAGVEGASVDAGARKIIEDAGYGTHFGHGLGHGVGLEVHEMPRVGPTSEDVLGPGMVVTIEPGVYLPEQFGVRIEDLVVVRPDGCEVLSGFPKDDLLVL